MWDNVNQTVRESGSSILVKKKSMSVGPSYATCRKLI